MSGLPVFVAAAAIVCIAVPAFGQAEVEHPANPYIHAQTGMKFPTAIGRFVRRHVNTYTSDGADTGVGYDLNVDQMKVGYVSVFIYPVPENYATARTKAARDSACKSIFDNIKHDVTTGQPNAKLLAQDAPAAPSPVFHSTGLRAAYEGSFDLGGAVQRTHDEAFLYCFAGERWLVAYRTTWASSTDRSAEVAAFMTALQWPKNLAR